MNKQLICLIKDSIDDQNKLFKLDEMCSFIETFRLNNTLDQMIYSLYDWLSDNYNISKTYFAIHENERDLNCAIFRKGEYFTLDDPFTYHFIVNTNTEQNGILIFCAEDENHYEIIKEDYKFLETLFIQISPMIENAIIRKLYIEQISIDSVTNVYKRDYLLDHIHKKILLAQDNEDIITFMMIGIDRFKAVIDEFDYSIGDKVLVELAKVIHGTIKSQDIVARLLGDEFLVAVLHTSDIDKITTQAQEIIDKFAAVEVVVNEETKQVLKKTVCIGISSYPQDGENIDEVIKNADKFLEEARNNKRGTFAIYKKSEESPIDLF